MTASLVLVALTVHAAMAMGWLPNVH
jgi:hypothetical protein